MKKPVFDYFEGWYDKDPERMKQVLHHLLVKRHPDKNQERGVSDMNLESLLNAVPLYGGQKSETRRVDISIQNSTDTIAAVKVLSNEYVDYAHLVKINNEWKIINVLWDYHTNTLNNINNEDITSLKKPIFDYVEGWYDKDVERIKRGLHSDLAKRSINSENPDGIDQYTRTSLLEVVPQFGGTHGVERVLEIEILDVQPQIASVKVISNSFIDYLHLCCVNGEWLILNVLWAFK